MLKEFSIGAARANISLRLHFTFWTIPPFSDFLYFCFESQIVFVDFHQYETGQRGWKFLLSRRSSYWGLRWVSLRNRGLRWAFATLSRPSSPRALSLRLFWENNLQSTSLEEKSWCRYTHYIAGVDQFSLCLTYFSIRNIIWWRTALHFVVNYYFVSSL